MASTSSQPPSSSTTPTKWDVFLSFRGIDTRNTFTSHLYSKLLHYNIPTFMDDPELRCGEVISAALLQAIQESKTYIVVISENYASSSWCLDELVEILTCKNTMERLVIPVFYNILPSVVRYQTGSFQEHFKLHEARLAGEMNRVNNWRVTLRQVADKSGKHVDGKRSEADIVKEIVDQILPQINPTALDVARYQVGLSSRVQEITTLMSSGTKDVIKIGIYGMGGVGKTTLAKALYNHLSPGSFKGRSCFLANVRETSGTSKGLQSLQQQLINDVLKCKNKFVVTSVAQGTKLIKARICSTKILVVIDDLDDHTEFESLVGPFSSGSVVIITTRDEETLDNIEVETRYRYKVNELGDAESERLFFRYALGDTTPDNTQMILSKDILRIAGGLPLALKVFGSYLNNKSKVRWESYIETLLRNPNKTIQQSLMISLNALESDDPLLKKMFLDIACFFIGWLKEEVVEILDTYYSHTDENIKILMKKSLLTINDNRFQMHDLLQDVGKAIVRNNSPDEPGKHSRLWKQEDIYYVLEEQKGTEAIEGIMLHFDFKHPSNEVLFAMETFRRMSKLKFLSLYHINLTGKFERALEDLRWFFWKRCPLKCLPFDFRPQKIVTLELPGSKMTTMWEENKVPNAFEKLKTLNMSSSRDLTTTPDFRRLPCLRKLNFCGCKSLKEVHNSIGSLVSLVSLNLMYCENLRSLPDSIGDLSKLVNMELGHCKELECLPDTICNLRALEVLRISCCNKVKELPEELGKIESLKELDAGGLVVLKLPDSIGYLSKLVKLKLGGNEELECLPHTICNLRALEVLSISDCTKVKELPEEFGKIESLKKLDACGLALLNVKSPSLTELDLFQSKMTALPSGISQLSNLKSLSLSNCDDLLSIAQLPPNLTYIDASHCWFLERINLSNLKHLEKLDLQYCMRLTEILGLGDLKSLKRMDLRGSTHTLTKVTKPLFQIYSGFEQEIGVRLESEEFPDWIIQSSVESVHNRIVDLSSTVNNSAEEFLDGSIQPDVEKDDSAEETSDLGAELLWELLIHSARTSSYDNSAEETSAWSSESIVNLQPNLSHNYLGMILCLECEEDEEDPEWEYPGHFSVMTSASNILTEKKFSGSSIVIVPRSIFTVTDADHKITFTSNARRHWIRLLYKNEDDSTSVNIEDERNDPLASDLEVEEEGGYPSKRLKLLELFPR